MSAAEEIRAHQLLLPAVPGPPAIAPGRPGCQDDRLRPGHQRKMPVEARSERDSQFVRGHVVKTRALRAFSQLLQFEPGHFSGARREAAHPCPSPKLYHSIPQAPVTGREDIANTIASVLRPGPPGIEGIDFRVINIAANGPVVMTERVDVFKLPDKSFELPVMGTFEVSGGKINAWRDYFDMNQFTSRMG